MKRITLVFEQDLTSFSVLSVASGYKLNFEVDFSKKLCSWNSQLKHKMNNKEN